MNYTKRPWEIAKDETCNGDIVTFIEDENFNTICNQVFKEEDARLIAAAPELFEALKEALTIIKCHIPRCAHLGQEIDRIVNKAEKALAKAEGR